MSDLVQVGTDYWVCRDAVVGIFSRSDAEYPTGLIITGVGHDSGEHGGVAAPKAAGALLGAAARRGASGEGTRDSRTANRSLSCPLLLSPLGPRGRCGAASR